MHVLCAARRLLVRTLYPIRHLFLALILFGTLLSLPLSAHADQGGTPTLMGRIQGVVWEDRNRNGQRDPDEPGLANVEIQLYRGNHSLLSLTHTANNGTYAFSGLEEGIYVVKEINPPGYISITGNDVTIILGPGEVRVANFANAPTASPTPTPTPLPPSTPTDTPTVTPTPTMTPTFTPTFTPSPLPPGCIDLVQNPGFEEDRAWLLPRTRLWPTYVGPAAFPDGGAPRKGYRAARLGVTQPIDPPSYSSVSQVITLPTSAHTITLEFWVWTFSTDTNGGDRQEAYLLDPVSGRIRVRIWRLAPAQNHRGWQQVLYDLTPYRGRSYRLYFNVFNDGDNAVSALFLDEVHVWACGYPTPTPTPTPTLTPTLPLSPLSPRPAEQPPLPPTARPSPTPTPSPTATPTPIPSLRGRIRQTFSQWTASIKAALRINVRNLALAFGLALVLTVFLLITIVLIARLSSPQS